VKGEPKYEWKLASASFRFLFSDTTALITLFDVLARSLPQSGRTALDMHAASFSIQRSRRVIKS
jgi:hypothetical protein